MRINLYDQIEKSPSGRCEDDFLPYIDTFLIESTRTPLGGVLVLPGGGYTHRANHEGDPVAERFNALGFHAFVLQYRVAPYRFPAPQRDLVRAVKVIRANAAKWHLDKLAVLGFSAGGHLAASGTLLADKIDADAGDEADKFSGKADAMILCYPVISLTDSFSHLGSGLALFGENSSVEERSKLDLQHLVTADTPPAFLWHTAEDTGVSVRNSTEFASRMWQHGNCCELHVFPHGNHGLGLGLGKADLSQWPQLAGTFLETSVKFNKA